MSTELFTPPPLLTAGLHGIGGRIKSAPEDFEVEEIPAYEPSGAGDFLYLWVEKRGLGADYFSRQVARRLDPESPTSSTAIRSSRSPLRSTVCASTGLPAGPADRLA